MPANDSLPVSPRFNVSTPTASKGPSEGEHPRHAGFLIRLAAGLVDILVMGIPVLLLAWIVLGSDAGEIVGFDWEYTGAGGQTQRQFARWM